MKKILIVEDTKENLQAAKSFFSTVKGFEFMYATSRKEAQELLPVADALLTDRSMPFLSTDSIGSYSNLKRDNDYKVLLERNGYDLLAQAVVMGIPRLMFTNHGTSNFFITLENKEICEEALRLKEDDYDAEHRLRILASVNNEAKRHRLEEYVTKDKSSSWELAWIELQKQF
ncbi:MAG: hypothetical protein Q7S84_02110 [bacterium]|nr:hypothetical protein [bacterium]